MNLTAAKYKYLIQQYKNLIYNYSRYMLKNQMDADDITQEVMIRIWQNMNKFKMSSSKGWIMRTTHNLCIDYLRKNSVATNRELGIDEYFEETYADKKEVNNPLTKVHLTMMTEKLKEAIQRLPENLRSVLVLYEIQGFKYREISKMLDVPVNSIKVYLFRARKKLQEELKNYEPHEVV